MLMTKNRIFLPLFLFATLFCAISAPANAADNKFGKWEAFSTTQDNEKICYIISYPEKKTGNYKRRSDPYFLVTYRGAGISEISAYSGYPYKQKSNVEVNIDSKNKHSLFTTNETPKIGWAKDSAEDKQIIVEMKKGIKMSVKGTSRLGTYSIDTYSLSGFTKAYEKMESLCKK